MSSLQKLGWSTAFERNWKIIDRGTLAPARVVVVDRGICWIRLDDGSEHLSQMTGRLKHQLGESDQWPVTGDWVAVQLQQDGPVMIHELLSRQTELVRRTGHARKDRDRHAERQVLAANVDIAFLTMSLNQDFNLRRLERYLILVAESGVRPIVVLTKTDLVTAVDNWMNEVKQINPSVPVLPISVYQQQGLDLICEFLLPGVTAVILGSSGVGKSTLINWLMGNTVMEVKAIRQDDDHGRHTTTRRQLFLLPQGGMLIDTPGLRDVQLEESSSGLEMSFEEILELEKKCRFTNCQHHDEPGCAVVEAMESHLLEPERYHSYLKLSREVAHQHSKKDKAASAEARKNEKKLHQGYRKILREKQRNRL
ncbi:MAG: ribosome small subunit-dependent GTPase A [SAR324 cluster bacterium]|nr:ribosome small subunit-dependent GTPase A [SAR324 cluster bacterium]